MKTYIIGFVDSQFHCLNVDDHNEYLIDFNIVKDPKNILVSFQSSEITRALKARKAKVVPEIIDLESLDKQMSRLGKDERDYSDWTVISALRDHDLVGSGFTITQSTMKQFLEKIAELYQLLLDESPEETDRFNTIEKEVNKIIYQRQMQGISVNLDLTADMCATLDHEIYEIKNWLQLEHRIFNPDNAHEQYRYLLSKKYKLSGSVRETFRAFRFEDLICEKIYTMMRKQDDLDSILYLMSHWGRGGRTFPEYHVFGTITSRITMRQPALQNLKKENRKMILPDTGKQLLYIDYSQFEAGILASLADDDRLIALYNSDIYADIAQNILKDKTKRDQAKIIFYRFMYGDGSLSEEIQNYFNRFPKLKSFRQQIDASVEKDKKIGTSKGNFRLAGEKDNGWALSHKIQATASLIYKSALIRVKNEVPSAGFLIPMHDATLYQIDKYLYDDAAKAVKELYEEEFKAYCPKINPKVTMSMTF